MFEGFVFDVEGTLVYSVTQNLRSLQDALERSGYCIPIQTLQLYSGLEGDQTLQLVVPEASERERQAILKDQSAIYDRDYLSSDRAFDGVRNIFKHLTENGGRVALATDCKGAAFKRYISLLNTDDYIAATACGDEVEHGKPDPRLVGFALRKLGLAAARAIMVADTPYDAEAGLEAGTKAAGVLTGGFSEDSLSGAGCLAVGRDVRALLPSLLFGEGNKTPSQSAWLRSA